MTIDELIEALEKADGPSEATDLEIWKYLNPATLKHGIWHSGPQRFVAYHTSTSKFQFDEHLPYYTGSLDAALTLVPKGRAWEMSGRASRTSFTAEISIPVQAKGIYGGIAATASTPVIALCIAALKARKATDEAPAG